MYELRVFVETTAREDDKEEGGGTLKFRKLLHLPTPSACNIQGLLREDFPP